MISIPVVRFRQNLLRCGLLHAFIVVFPGSLEGLRFLWVIQKRQMNLQPLTHRRALA